MTESLSQRLGLDPQQRTVVIHCDDIGMCDAANQGAFEALENGPATCGSLMVPCSHFDAAAAHAKLNPELDLGVHLTLNSEQANHRFGPLLGRDAVPSLCDDAGYLFATSFETVQRAKPDEVERELRAQIEHALASGIDVTHIDSHMGTCFWPQFIEIYARLAVEFRLAAFAMRPNQELLDSEGIAGAIEPVKRALDALEAANIPLLDGVCADSLRFAPGDGEPHNRRRLARLGPGVSYLICHPALGNEELERVTPESAALRDFERRFYGGDAGHQALAEEGLQTLGMRPLRDLVRAAT